MTETAALPLGRPLSGWTTRPWPPRQRLDGKHVRLEPLDCAVHGEALFAAVCGDPALWTYLPHPMPTSAAQLTQALAAANAGPQPLFQTLIICDQASGAVLGMISQMRIDPANGSIEVGFVLYGPKLARSRGATEAQALLARHVFEDLGYRRYEWKCNGLNAASRQAAVRLGFRYEGVFRNAMVAQGRNRDTAWYAMTDADWPHIGPVLDAWLADANFEADGCQRQSLTAMMLSAQAARETPDIISALGLKPHPEGGWYAETWRDSPSDCSRGAGTAIYYLLKAGERSCWHRVDAAELWLWHAGAPLLLQVSGDGRVPDQVHLGPALEQGERPQALVPASAWQAARSLGAWSLVSCAVAPAFQFSGFELAPPGWSPEAAQGGGDADV